MVVAIAGFACGDNVPAPHVAGGARLEPRFLAGAGVQQLIGWHDQQLDLDCGFEGYAARREHRCIPDLGFPNGYYADATCSVELATADGSATLVMVAPSDACTADPRFFALGSAVATPFQLDTMTGSCEPAPSLPFTEFLIGSAVDETIFASAAEVAGDDGQLRLESDDGAIIPWGGWDGHRAVQPTSTSAGLRWAPWIVAYETFYADPQCTVVAAAKDANNAMCPLDAVLVFPPTFGHGSDAVDFYEIGPALDAVYFQDGSACAPVPFGPVDAFGVGAKIDPATMPAATFDLAGSGALQIRNAVLAGRDIDQTITNPSFGGNGPPRPDQLVDAASGLPCSAALGSDGVTRCFPPALADDIYFLDSACTELVAPSFGSDIVPPLYTYFQGDGATHAREPSGPVQPAPATLFFESMTSATDLGSCSSTPGQAYAPLGPELPASRFAELQVVTGANAD